jgi:predicted permease
MKQDQKKNHTIDTVFVICLLLLFASGYVQRNPNMRPVALVVMIGASAPCAATIVQMVVVSGKDAMKASIYNVMSTILCVVTIPVMILLFQILFPG